MRRPLAERNSVLSNADAKTRAAIDRGRKRAAADRRAMEEWAAAGFASWTRFDPPIDEDEEGGDSASE